MIHIATTTTLTNTPTTTISGNYYYYYYYYYYSSYYCYVVTTTTTNYHCYTGCGSCFGESRDLLACFAHFTYMVSDHVYNVALCN